METANVFWHIFARTGSITAYLAYKRMKARLT